MSQPMPPVPPRAPQASDPAVLTNGQVLPRRVQQAPPGGGSFRIEMDRAPQAIKELKSAQDQLTQLRRETAVLARVTPPARDSVSTDAATVLSATAGGGPGSLIHALDQGIEQIKLLVSSMERDLAAYTTTERSTAEDIGRINRG